MSTISNTVFSQNTCFSYPLSHKRLNRILKSDSLKEAQFMGLIDRLFDRFFRNGQKRETIIKLYEQIACPANEEKTFEEMPYFNMALRFDKLRQLANEEYQQDFKILINDDDSSSYSFSFVICDDVIFESDWLSREKNANCFQGICTLQVTHQFENDLYQYPQFLGTDNLIKLRIQTMSDEPEVQRMLEDNLQNPAFSGSNLIAIKDLPSEEGRENNCFVAQFNDRELKLSNRRATVGEFRAEPLKQALLKGDFDNLEQLCSLGLGLMTKENPLLSPIIAFSEVKLKQRLNIEISKSLDHHHNLDFLKTLLSVRPIGKTNTTLCKFFGLEMNTKI